jgi:hypothetical protein
MRKHLILAAVALLCPFTWAAPALAQACYGESYSSYSYGGGACYSGSYAAAIGPAYSTTGSVYYAAPIATVGSRVAYRAFHPVAGLRGRFAARRALRGSYGVGGACYSDGYGGGCYSGGYGAGYAPYYAAPAHYHAAPMAYAPMAYQPTTWAAPANCPNGFCPQVRPNGGTVPTPAPAPMPAPMPSPQVAPVQPGAGTHPCPCGDAACNHTLGACPCTDPACKCHLPGPSVVPAPAPVAPHHPDRDHRP